METFKIILSPKAQKDLDRFRVNICKKISKDIRILENNPFPRGKMIKKIKGKHSDFYRLRMDKYRVIYMIDGQHVVILRILNKRDTERFIQSLS